MTPLNCIIMGAAGRDFHDFLTFFSSRPDFRVCCFTAEQIPFIEQRRFPAELAGPAYSADIPIFPEARLEELIERFQVNFVFLAYSDLAHEEVMHKVSRVQAAGASFAMLGPAATQLRSELPVIAVTAARTGAGKSPLCQALASHLMLAGHRPGVVRHPMPYGDLMRQRVQHFAVLDDLDRHACTLEEREEYRPYLERGMGVFAGVDYAAVLQAAEQHSDVILWDGGNNDMPFIRSDLLLVVLDALRPGHEIRYYPGETNLRCADMVILNKVSGAERAGVAEIRRNVAQLAPRAQLIEADLRLVVHDPERITNKRVIVIEDGPTVTHGSMPSGAGALAAHRYGAASILDARRYAFGSIAEAYARYPHIDRVLPALGYSDAQQKELVGIIARAAPEVVVDASPARVAGLLDLNVPVVEVYYQFEQVSGPNLLASVDAFLARRTASST